MLLRSVVQLQCHFDMLSRCRYVILLRYHIVTMACCNGAVLSNDTVSCCHGAVLSNDKVSCCQVVTVAFHHDDAVSFCHAVTVTYCHILSCHFVTVPRRH